MRGRFGVGDFAPPVRKLGDERFKFSKRGEDHEDTEFRKLETMKLRDGTCIKGSFLRYHIDSVR